MSTPVSSSLNFSEDPSENDLKLAEILVEFEERQERGEFPQVGEYVARYPELADQLRQVLRAAAAVQGYSAPHQPVPLAQTLSPISIQEQIGDYRIVREVGRGGMGIVYEAVQISLGRSVALKILPPQIGTNSRAVERFQREARSAARLHHTNIVPVFEVGQEGPICFYAMQLIPGQGLDQVIDQLRREQTTNRDPNDPAQHKPTSSDALPIGSIAHSLMKGTWEHPISLADQPTDGDSDGDRIELSHTTSTGPTAPLSSLSLSTESHTPFFRSVARIGQQVAEALGYAHQRGIIHRDIKPSNLILDESGIVWVTDFGLAQTDEEGLTHSGDILGTIRYMAPERLRNQGDGRSDVYSLGLTLYEMLCFRPAFAATDRLELVELIREREPIRPRTIQSRIPRDLETVVLKAIEKDPRRRYTSPGELAADLKRFLDGEPVRARRITSVERTWKWARRNPALAIAMVAVVLAMATGTTISTILAFNADAQARAALKANELADDRELEAIEARDRERTARYDAVRQTTQSIVRQAHLAGAAGRIDEAVEGLRQALQIAPREADSDQQYRRALQRDLDSWQRSLPILRQTLQGTTNCQVLEPEGRVLAYVTQGGRELRKLDLITGQMVGSPHKVPEGVTIKVISPTGHFLFVTDARALPQDSNANTPDFGFYDTQTGQVIARLSQQRGVRITGQKIELSFWPDDRHVGLSESGFSKPRQGKNIVDGNRFNDKVALVTKFWSTSRFGLIEANKEFEHNKSLSAYDLRTFCMLRDRHGHNVVAWMPIDTDPQANDVSMDFYDLDARQNVVGVELTEGSSQRNWFVRDGNLHTVQNSGRVEVWDPSTGKPLSRAWKPLQARYLVRVAADGRTLIVACEDSRLRCFDLVTRDEVNASLDLGPIRIAPQVQTSASGMFVIVVNASNDATEIWQLPSPLRPRLADPSIRRSRFAYAALNPTGDSVGFGLTRQNQEKSFVPVALTDSFAQVNLNHRWPIGYLSIGAYNDHTYSHDGKWVAVTSGDSRNGNRRSIWPDPLIEVHDASTGESIVPPIQAYQHVFGLAFSHDKTMLAMGLSSTVCLYDLSNQRFFGLVHLPGTTFKLEFSPDDKYLVGYMSHSKNPSVIRVWSLPNLKRVGSDIRVDLDRPGNTYNQNRLVDWHFAEDGQSVLLFDTANGLLYRKDFQETTQPPPLKLRAGKEVPKLKFFGLLDPRGEQAALVVPESNSIQVYETNQGQAIGKPIEHPLLISRFRFSPDGRTLVSTCTDGSVRIWDTATGLQLGPTHWHSSPVLALAFTSDCDAIRVIQANADIATWPVPAVNPEDERAGDVVDADPISWHRIASKDAEADGDLQAAKWHLEQLMKLKREDWRLAASLAHVYRQMGQFEPAERIETQLHTQVSRKSMLSWYAWCSQEAIERNKFDLAFWYLDRLTNLDPNLWWSHATRARVLEQLGQSDEAHQSRLQAIRAGAPGTYLQGVIEQLGNQGKIEEAVQLSALGEGRGASYWGLIMMAGLQARVGHWENVLVYLRQAKKTNMPGRKFVLDNLNLQRIVFLRKNDSKSYLEVLKVALDMANQTPPDDLQSLTRIMWTIAMGPCPPELAERASQIAYEIYGTESEGQRSIRKTNLSTVAVVVYRFGRYQEAIDYLEQRLDLLQGTGDFQDYAFLAMAHSRLGHLDQAKSWLVKASQSFNESTWANPWVRMAQDLLYREAKEQIWDASFPEDPFER